MLHEIYSYSRIAGPAAGQRNRTVQAGSASINPWLRWRPERPHAPQVLTVAELAECHCPDICNRDHANE